VKNCDLVLENSSCGKLAYKWVCLRNFAVELTYRIHDLRVNYVRFHHSYCFLQFSKLMISVTNVFGPKTFL